MYMYVNVLTPHAHSSLLTQSSHTHSSPLTPHTPHPSHSSPSQSYSGLRGAVAFSLALARLHGEPALDHPDNCTIYSELQLRKTMLTAITFLVLFTVFVQVSHMTIT